MLSFKQYLIEITLKDLADGTAKFRFPVDKYPQAKFVNINKIVPSVGVKTLTFFGEIPSFTRGEAGYNQTIMFKNVEFSEEEPQVDKEQWYKLEDKDLWYKKPKLDKNDVAGRCGCADDRFMWQYARKQKKALYGNLIKYVKKTNRPPKNPDNIAGICKHLKNFTLALIQNGYIQE